MVTYKYSFENNYEVQIDNWRNPDFKMLVDDRGWVDKQLEKKRQEKKINLQSA